MTADPSTRRGRDGAPGGRARGGAAPRLVGFMNAFSDGMSGGDACFIETARRLEAWDLVVVTSALGRRAAERRGLRAAYWLTSRERQFRRVSWTYLRRTLRSLALLGKLRPGDLVYASSDCLPDTLPAFLARALVPRTRWVQRAYHVIPAQRRRSHLAQKASLALIRRRCDLVVTSSARMRGQLAERGVPLDRIRLNYPGIDLELYAAARAAPPAFDAVVLGRVHPSKGVLDLVDIWSRVVRRRPAARLGVVGRGAPPVVRDLKHRLRAAGLERAVELLGFLDDAAARRVVAGSRLLVSPSREEGFGMAVLEALASGTPAVVWDLPTYREAFPQGLVRVPQGDAAAFAAAIERLLADEDARQALAKHGRAAARGYSWERAAQRESQLLAAVAAAPAGNRANGVDTGFPA